MASGGAAYQVDEKVLCFHGPQIYEAKIKEVKMVVNESGVKEPSYFVHYANWNKTWDEWVNDDRVMKHNDANLIKQKELQASNKHKGQKKKKAADDRSTKKRRAERDEAVDGEDDHLSRPEVRIAIPDDLKQRLVEDWDQIIHKNRLARLPRTMTVTRILSDYLASVKSRGPKIETLATEITAGLKVYFEEAPGSILLYKFERQQFQQLRAENADTPLCDLYGPEHLLRLFTKLPMLLAHSAIEERAMTQLVTSLQDVLRYIERNASTIFTEEYEVAGPAYLKQAQV